MRPGPRGVCMSALLVGAYACGDSQLHYLDQAVFDSEHVFFVELDELSRLSNVRGPVQPRRDDEPPLRFESKAPTLIAIGFEDRDLGNRFEPARASELMLEATGPACSDPELPGLVSLDGRILERTLPVEASFETWDVETDVVSATAPGLSMDLRGTLSLTTPIDATNCTGRMGSENELRAFADRAVPIPEDAELDGLPLLARERQFSDVVRTSDGRALAAGGGTVFLFERGQPFEVDASHALRLPDAYGLEAIDLDPDPRRGPGQDRLRVLAVGRAVGARAGAIWEISVGPEGLAFVQTATTARAVVSDVDIDPATGHAIAALEDGSLLVQSNPNAAWALYSVPGFGAFGDNPAKLARTGWAKRPYVVGGTEDLAVYFSESSLSEWTPIPNGLQSARTYRAFGRVVQSGETEVWTVSSGGHVYRLRDESIQWERVGIAMPPSYACSGAQPTCGWREHHSKGTELSSVERGGQTWVYITGKDCFAVAEVRADGACASYLVIPDPVDPQRPLQVPTKPDGAEFYMTGGRVFDGWLMLSSELGAVYELWVGEGDAPE